VGLEEVEWIGRVASLRTWFVVAVVEVMSMLVFGIVVGGWVDGRIAVFTTC